MGEGGGGEEKGRCQAFLSFSSLSFSLPSFPFSPETPDTQARADLKDERETAFLRESGRGFHNVAAQKENARSQNSYMS